MKRRHQAAWLPLGINAALDRAEKVRDDHLRETVGKRFLRGILLYTGSSSVAFAPDMHAVPVSALWRMA